VVLLGFVLGLHALDLPYSQTWSLVIAGASSFLFPLQSSKNPFRSIWKSHLLSILSALEILALVGILIGLWKLGGTMDSMMRLGFLFMDPMFFLVSTAFTSALGALVSGSSWTTAGTLGTALLAIGETYGFSPGMVAGAIVSGAYFGDKLSPLSDTTNLASSVTGTDLFLHIRKMAKTTLPTFLFALILFGLIPFLNPPKESISQNPSLDWGKELIPPVLVFGLSLLRCSPRISLLAGILSSSVISLMVSVPWREILSSGFGAPGFLSVLPTEALILGAIFFGSCLEKNGQLGYFFGLAVRKIQSLGDLLLACMFSSLGLNLMTADQYLSLVIPGRSFQEIAARVEVPSYQVSRALEDMGTLSSPLIPWNSCGAFMSLALGVGTWEYLPYAWFPGIHIGLALFLAWKKRSHKFIKPLDSFTIPLSSTR